MLYTPDMEKTLNVKCRAFEDLLQTHRVLVSDSTVRVWDDVAQHYTLCHGLSPREIRRIVKLAGLSV